ncbi:hypothetical protein B0H14DRAFT_3073487 [Mycena olivaceomarginata]|nr:hypothetical protein B0H14DRAFT_3073487 [Mycena olivaceomarginata]
MDSEYDSEDPSLSGCTADYPGHASVNGGAIFSGSHNFTVAGGIFNNITKISPVPREIHLQRQLTLNKFSSRYERASVRCVYSARIRGGQSTNTVALYQGDGAEQGIVDNISSRHPTFVQLWAVTSSPTIYGAVFHDDLIPFEHDLESYHDSYVLTLYTHVYCSPEFWEANDYFSAVFQQRLCLTECTFWMCRSTGQLRTDIRPSNIAQLSRSPVSNGIALLNTLIQEVESLSLQKYHEICYWDLSQLRHISMSTRVTVNLGAVLSWPSYERLQETFQIAALVNVEAPRRRWSINIGVGSKVMENDWTRYRGCDIGKCTLRLHLWYWNPECWLSQANRIFKHLQISENFQDYVVVDDIAFEIRLAAECHSPGYLFIAPLKDFEAGPSCFRWPDYPVYWSLDSSGGERLSTEEANELGFPALQFNTMIRGKFWNADVYAGLGQFHHGKGFNPISEEVSLHLGDQLYQVSGETDCPVDQEDEEGPISVHTEDKQPKPFTSHDEPPPSSALEFTMYLQMTLIVILALFRLFGCIEVNH